MSGNHNQSIDRALAIVKLAADAGAHAIKLQTYTADTMTIKGAYRIDDKIHFGTGRNFMTYTTCLYPWEWHQQIFQVCKRTGHGRLALRWCYFSRFSWVVERTCIRLHHSKIPITHCWKIARTKKPVIMSTGVSTWQICTNPLRFYGDNGWATDFAEMHQHLSIHTSKIQT